jgi:hypothetical protein
MRFINLALANHEHTTLIVFIQPTHPYDDALNVKLEVAFETMGHKQWIYYPDLANENIIVTLKN